jgi:type IV pilus assembly protein PilY1
MMADLKTNPDGSVSNDAAGQARLEYIRGDRSNENNGYAFRSRQSLLGDIVHSGPVYVGAPSLGWPDTTPFPDSSGSRYSDFKNGAAKNREGVIYVGSNDGMLHAFSAANGKELFAYVPNLIATTDQDSGYHYLTDPGYTHNWYVDLTPTVSDAFLNVGGSTGWHTLLIGGLRGGGRGLFALNVTDPSDFDEAHADKVVMWEFSQADDPDLGYTYSQPTIALANNGKWVAIFGNGYNDTGDGEAKLFILDIEAGQDGWQTGDYIEITTKAGDTSNRNGLATPALADIDGNGTVDRVYAGDLEGNMWAFDLSGSSSGSWDVAYSDGGNPAPLFTTQSGQPITSKPVLAYHPSIPNQSSPSNAPNLMVYFGTGQYLVLPDRNDTSTQSFYGVWDRGDKQLDISNLVEQTFDSSYTQRVLSRNFVDYSSKHGWRFDLPTAGERVITTAVARADTVFFNTFIPRTNDPCELSEYGYKFAVDMLTGGSPAENVVDANNDGIVDDDDYIDSSQAVTAAIQQDGYLPEPVFIEDFAFTGKVATRVKKLPDLPTGRFSWQELIK